MPRIYLDSNVFSNLKSNKTSTFQALNKCIELYTNNLSFFFSHAHIRDKKKDTTDFKFEDFAFMEKIVGDNYICYHGLKKNTSFYLATPKMVYDDEDLEGENDILLDFWKEKASDEPLLGAMKSILKRLFSNVNLQTDIKTDSISEDDKKLLEKLVPIEENGEINFGKLLTHFSNFQHQLLTDSETYKELRSHIDKSINAGKLLTVDGDYDFNEGLKDSIVKKSFIQFVEDSCKSEGKDEILVYDFYLKSYASLDLLGISKDTLSKKNRFSNLFNDGLHSYYARYCDFFVSDDSQTIRKTKALYNLYGVDTQVVNSVEFLSIITKIGNSSEDHLIHFFEKLAKDIKEMVIVDSKEIDEGLVSQAYLELPYLNTFDELLELTNDDGRHFYLSKLEKHPLSQPNFREMGQIINRCIALFGTDLSQAGTFDFEKEVKEIDDNSWKGRFWKIGTLHFYLHKNEGFKKLCLWISSIPTST